MQRTLYPSFADHVLDPLFYPSSTFRLAMKPCVMARHMLLLLHQTPFRIGKARFNNAKIVNVLFVSLDWIGCVPVCNEELYLDNARNWIILLDFLLNRVFYWWFYGTKLKGRLMKFSGFISAHKMQFCQYRKNGKIYYTHASIHSRWSYCYV